MEQPMPRNILLPCDEICSAYLAGQSTTLLARRYGCSPTTIAKNLRMCGITPRRSRFAPAQIEEATLQRLYLRERWPIAAIAAHFGVSASTVGNQRRRYGIPVRPRHITAGQHAESRPQ
jgi:transcriptional regulator of aromatic amino acid metabolism